MKRLQHADAAMLIELGRDLAELDSHPDTTLITAAEAAAKRVTRDTDTLRLDDLRVIAEALGTINLPPYVTDPVFIDEVHGDTLRERDEYPDVIEPLSVDDRMLLLRGWALLCYVGELDRRGELKASITQ